MVRDGDATLRRMCIELSGKWRALLCHRRRGDVPWTNNVTGARDRQKQDKVQDGQGVQERRRDAERVWADSVGMERPGRLGVVGAGRGRNSAPPAGGAASSETRPKMTNRFWDGYGFSAAAKRARRAKRNPVNPDSGKGGGRLGCLGARAYRPQSRALRARRHPHPSLLP